MQLQKEQNEQNVRWLLVVSVVLFIFTTGLLGIIELYPGSPNLRRFWSDLDNFFFYIHRIDILFFVATITTATLYTTSFEKKDLMFKVSMYLFLISMILFFVTLLKLVFV
jgi:hypothetical protein